MVRREPGAVHPQGSLRLPCRGSLSCPSSAQRTGQRVISLVTGVLEHLPLGVRQPFHRDHGGPWPCKRGGVVDRVLVSQDVVRGATEPFSETKILSGTQRGETVIVPGAAGIAQLEARHLVGEVRRLHNECVAVPSRA